MALKKPVKIQWTRETEQAQGWYRPALMARLRGVISDKTGCLIGLHVRTSGTSLRQEFAPGGLPADTPDNAAVQNLADIRYRVGAYRLDYAYRHIPVPTAPWRAVGATHNAFFLECFIDEIAAQVKRDPLELRREMLAHDDRALTVINTLAKASGWGTPLAKGRARGLAYFESYGSLCAQVAEVSVVEGRPKVHKVWVALDCGQVVMPDGARSQVEGGVVQGLSSMLGEAVTLNEGQAVETNFDSYQLLRLPQAPEIETIFIENDQTMGGVGEPPLPPVIPAVANALFALTGKPIRKLPIGTL
jgi:isoquinoline 1-oxidoreductase beta subunit